MKIILLSWIKGKVIQRDVDVNCTIQHPFVGSSLSKPLDQSGRGPGSGEIQRWGWHGFTFRTVRFGESTKLVNSTCQTLVGHWLLHVSDLTILVFLFLNCLLFFTSLKYKIRNQLSIKIHTFKYVHFYCNFNLTIILVFIVK